MITNDFHPGKSACFNRTCYNGLFTPATRQSSCVNARGIPTAAYQVLHLLSYPGVGVARYPLSWLGVPPPPQLDLAGVPPWLAGYPPTHVGYPPPGPGQDGGGYPVRTTEGVLTTRRAVCPLHSRRRTFLFEQFLSDLKKKILQSMICVFIYCVFTIVFLIRDSTAYLFKIFQDILSL